MNHQSITSKFSNLKSIKQYRRHVRIVLLLSDSRSFLKIIWSMAQQQITVPDHKQKLSQPQPQEINGSDHLNEKNDEEDNEFIERNIIAQMTTDEMDALCSGLYITRLIDRKLDWAHISSAVMHELDEGASYHVMNAVKKLDISSTILSEALLKKLNNKMSKQEIHYIRNLVQRATQHTKEAPPATASLIRRRYAPRDEDAGGLNADTLIDIYETYRLYKFSTFQFETYSKDQFMKAIDTNKFLKQNKNQIISIFNESYDNRTG
eukprot:243109_1